MDKIEKAARIGNPHDFRHEIVNFSLRYARDHKGKNPDWKSYEKIKVVIEKNMFNAMDDVLPIISFAGQRSKGEQKEHEAFVKRMTALGYTEIQVKRVVEWYMRARHS